ncbi:MULTISPECIES: alpha-mannosidase [unclassified Clostridium]|uniref:alpha-mannosidase n=1 Tax=Clostridium TaxID=1485 RepID=UPI001C8BD486|nr:MULTISPECIES: alpha-mannosidase [unclassified Clostridium]MBX9138276.1 alpha-mannosidase [Clostridium sp. K12(2020)]MBX9144992.1 alpha-mannosidase [Clostridium sp. K13]
MRYILERVRKIATDIKENVYTNKLEIKNFQYKEGNFLGIEAINSDTSEWINFNSDKDNWGGTDDKHFWFRTSVTVPQEFEGQVLALDIYAFEEGWDAVNPQFILYVNGEHIQGLDINHREVILTNNAKAGEVYEIDLHSYTGRTWDKRLTLNASLVTIDLAARDLYFNLQVPVWSCEKIDEDDKKRIDMLLVLNDAINLLDLRKVFSKEYNESIKKANEFLEVEFYEKLCGHEDYVATCVGHTHIDVAWWWTVAQTREKVGRSFSTVLKLMDQYPEYIFMSSQPQLYKFIKEDYPDIYEKIKEKVKEGVWEPEGAMWLEADCNVTSGESLIRQILHGKRFFKEEFNVENEVLWLPDVFGYSAALPQILKKSNVNYFMTTKIAWNQFNKMPYDTFMWKGIDGTEILTHFITTTDPNQDKKCHFTTYNGILHPGSIKGAWDRYQQKEINDDVLVCYGYGDGGGGVSYEMLETGRRMAKGIPGMPKVKLGNSLDYFKKLEKKVEGNKRLPRWVGELYLEYHRGTYTSMARNKRDNRISEQLYESTEKVNSLAMLLGKEYPAENINKNWENILLNQFHDILPGTSIKKVYDVTDEDYKRIIGSGKEMLADGINYIAENISLKNKSVVVFNTLGFDRDDIVEFEVPSDINMPAVLDGNEEIECQLIDDGKAIFFAKGIPANGHKAFEIIEATKSSSTNLTIEKNYIENKFFDIKINEEGNITSIIDKKSNREVLKEGQTANVLQAFEDKPMDYDNWDIDIYYDEKMWLVNDVQHIEVIERGNVRSTLEIKRKFQDSTIIQKVYIYNDIPRIDFDTNIDWKESQVLLKAAFPVDINSNEATYEIQYGNVKRPTHRNTSWDEARFEVCGHKWVDLSEGNYGVSLMNNSKYGHDILDGVMRLTLLKSGILPNTTSDQEVHNFIYSIYPHTGDYKDAGTVKMAYNLNVPLYSKVEEAHEGSLESKSSLVKVDKDNVIIEVIKKAEDSDELVIRMYECHNMRTNVTLEMISEIESVKECNLMETDISELSKDGNKVSFEMKPFEILTLKVKLK